MFMYMGIIQKEPLIHMKVQWNCAVNFTDVRPELHSPCSMFVRC